MEINCPDADLAGRSYDGPNETKRERVRSSRRERTFLMHPKSIRNELRSIMCPKCCLDLR
jgi:hypothetical protein